MVGGTAIRAGTGSVPRLVYQSRQAYLPRGITTSQARISYQPEAHRCRPV